MVDEGVIEVRIREQAAAGRQEWFPLGLAVLYFSTVCCGVGVGLPAGSEMERRFYGFDAFGSRSRFIWHERVQ